MFDDNETDYERKDIALMIIDEGESGEVIHCVENDDGKDDKYDNNRNKDNKGILICRKR